MTSIRARPRLRPGLMAALSLAGLVPALSAQAAPAVPGTEKGRSAVVQAISDCRKLTDNDARLACYDKAAGAFDQAEAQGQVVVVDREQVRTVRRQSFGFNIPSISIFNRGPREETIDRVTVELSGGRQGADGKWVLTTKEDAVWRQIDTNGLYDPPHDGSKMAIRKAMLGSFFCNIDGQPALRCVRER